MISLTNRQARRFLLLKHGLLGRYRFTGKEGALAFVRQAGCIQFDPVDVCGKNAELTLQSRVKGFTKRQLYELLYRDRALVDYPDKNLSIFPTEDWPYFARYRQRAYQNGLRFEGLAALEAQAKAYLAANGPASADTLPIEGKIHWHSAIHWSGNWQGQTGAARSVLEQLYSTGELVIHSKDGARKRYDLAENHLPESLLTASDPLPDDMDHLTWRIYRRIGACGFLWDRPSDAFLGIENCKPPQRKAAFERLIDHDAILPAAVENIRAPLYCQSKDLPLLKAAMSDTRFAARCALLAPLDPMLWDRKLIRALFDFAYTWEIYTPQSKRQYGYYVLPLLYGERFVGRVQPIVDRKTNTLRVEHLWYENGFHPTPKFHAALESCLKRFAAFNDCEQILFTK